ncbi:MAG: hypothetical protein OXC45_02490 [Gemmatimonadetes bacterium]|nr:hypothetical protein [Gemmatimonadota bacterium]
MADEQLVNAAGGRDARAGFNLYQELRATFHLNIINYRDPLDFDGLVTF